MGSEQPIPVSKEQLGEWGISQSDKYQDTQNELNKEFRRAVDIGWPQKDNPKDAIGSRKAPSHYTPVQVLTELDLAMMEGGIKYGAYNWRIAGVRASIYVDALNRHMRAYWAGEDIDPGSKELRLHHIVKAIATLTVLYDAILNDKCEDDRPPKSTPGWQEGANNRAKEFLDNTKT